MIFPYTIAIAPRSLLAKKRIMRFETRVTFTIPSLFLFALTAISLFLATLATISLLLSALTTISLFLAALTTIFRLLSAVGIDFDNGHLRVCRSERSNGRAALFFFPVLVLRDGVNHNGRW